MRAAQRVYGIRAVTNEMKVDLPAVHQRDDRDIARAALNALQWDIFVPSDSIKVKVEDGWVTLDGSWATGISKTLPKTPYAT